MSNAKYYRVTFEGNLAKKNHIKNCKIAITVEVNNGDFVKENFEQFIVGQKVNNWLVLDANVIKHKIISQK